MKKLIIALLASALLLAAGCSQDKKENSTDSSTQSSLPASAQGSNADAEGSAQSDPGYRQITQEEARSMMDTESGYIILDVRTQQEFDEGHIPNAVCIPNETITSSDLSSLPDKSQLIFVYCRSGRRSKEAAAKLAELGYTNIVEFGGIIDWTGPIELG